MTGTTTVVLLLLFTYPLGVLGLVPISLCGRSVPSRHFFGTCTPLFSSPDAIVSDAPSGTAIPDNLHEGVWMQPSQNKSQLRGNVFSVQQTADLLDFVAEDDRLSVVKVYASWCITCKKFDMRYKKVANKFGDKYDGKTGKVTKKGRARFAEMQYDDPNNKEILSQVLNAKQFPYIIMYKGRKGKIREFQCLPAKFQKLVDAVDELADPIVKIEGANDEFEEKVIELGLADRR